MIKTITFNEYILTKKKNPNKSLNKIFKLAWIDSKQGREQYIKRKKILKIFLVLGMTSISFLFISNLGQLSAYADMNGINLLKSESPKLLSKLKYLVNIYSNASHVVGKVQGQTWLLNIIKETFNPQELVVFQEALKGIEFDDFIQIINSL